MSHIELAAAVAAVVGVSLTGCTSLLSSSSSEQLQALNFESDPPGAEINTNQLQTCITPCTLTVPSQDQAVVITRDGYASQTVQVTTAPPPEHSFWQHPPPTLVPNSVHVVLQPVPTPVRRAKGHTAVSAPAPTALAQSAAVAGLSAFPSAPPPPKQ